MTNTGGSSSSNKRSGDSAATATTADASTTKHEHPLQAVLLADSFDGALDNAFAGLSLSSANSAASASTSTTGTTAKNAYRPKMLCPLNNVVLLDYAMDYLAGQCGVQEVIVVCTSDQIKAHVEKQQQQQQQRQRRTDQPSQPFFSVSEQQPSESTTSGSSTASNTNNRSMTVKVLLDKSLTNAGDALRELDRRDWVQSNPFVLLYGDVITNIDISTAIQQHKQRYKKDRAAIMTCIFQTVGPTTLTTTTTDTTDTDSTAAPSVWKSPLRPVTEDLILGIDPAQDNRILLYDDTPSSGTVALPCSFFTTASHGGMTVMTNVLDVGLDLCSPDVLARFTDEFDYRDIRRKFVTNCVAEEEEGLQNKIHAHFCDTTTYSSSTSSSFPYAARVHDFATYHAISRDLLQRWCYPVVPDNLPIGYNHYSSGSGSGSGSYRYKQTQQCLFWYQETKHGKARIGRSSIVTGPGMMGASTFVGEHCILQRTVLGNHVHVSDHVTMTDCHVWDSVEIGPHCQLTMAIVGDGAVLREGAIISRGCIIGAGVVVGKNVLVPPYTRLTTRPEINEQVQDDWNDDDDDEDDEEDDDNEEEEDEEDEGEKDEAQVKAADSHNTSGDIETDHDVVGPDGIGRVWKPMTTDEDHVEECQDLYGMTVEEVTLAQSLGYNPLPLYWKRFQQLQKEKDVDEFSDHDDDDEVNKAGGLRGTTGLDAYDDDDDAVTFGVASPVGATVNNSNNNTTTSTMIIGRQKGVDVIKELKTICLEYEHNAPIENLAIELNSFKFSQNATYSDCTMAATLAIVEQLNITKTTKDSKLLTEFKAALHHWAPLLQKMSIGMEEERAIVLALERCATDPTAIPVNGSEVVQVLSTGLSFRLLLQTLHDEEIVSEEAIFAWADERRKELPSADSTNTSSSPRAQLFQLAPVQEFLAWLEEDDSEDDDDDDEEEEDGSESE